MDGVIINNFWLNVFIAAMALALHFSSKWTLARNTAPTKAERPSLSQFFMESPAQHMTSFISASLMFTLAFAMGWLNPIAAFGSGYIPNSMIDNVTKQFETRIKSQLGN